jgi:hypothetical protein
MTKDTDRSNPKASSKATSTPSSKPRSSRRGIPRSRQITLVVVACLGLLVWAKPMGLLLWARIRILTSIPKTAIADPEVAQAPKPSQPNELDPLLPGIGTVLRDPFRVDASVFPAPKAAETPAGTRAETARPATPEPEQKSTQTDPNADESTVPSAYEEMRLAAESLRVQSAGAGLSIAIIQDKALRVGETVTTTDGVEFTLVKVLDGAVVLGREGREFVVRMPAQAPGAPSAPPSTRPTPKKTGGKP